MDLQSYARMSQVNRSWNKAARKHKMSGDAQNREATFERERRFAAEASARRRRDAAANFGRKVCHPCIKFGKYYCKHCGLATCFVVALLFCKSTFVEFFVSSFSPPPSAHDARIEQTLDGPS